MPVSAELAYLYWDITEARTDRWEVTVRRQNDGAILHRFSVPGAGGDGWIHVPPDTRGTVTLAAQTEDHMTTVATLDFLTPPTEQADGSHGSGRWVRLGTGGPTFIDAEGGHGNGAPPKLGQSWRSSGTSRGGR